MNERASAALLDKVDRLLNLRPIYSEYKTLEAELAGLMKAAQVGEINLPGKGRVERAGNELIVFIESLAYLRPFI